MTDEEMFLAFVHDRDAACPACGYNVRDLHSPRCPECGRELRLTIGTPEPYLKPWITLIVILCASGGVGLLCFIVFLKQGWPDMNIAGKEKAVFDATYLFHILTTPVAVLAVFTRRRFMHFQRKAQWAMTTIVAVVCGLAFTLFMMFLR